MLVHMMQVLLSLVDQTYFGSGFGAGSSTDEVWAEIAAKYSSIPYVPGTHVQVWMRCG